MAKLWLESIIVGTKHREEGTIVLAVDGRLLGSVLLLRLIVLVAGPGHQVSARGQWRVPSGLEETVVLSLQGLPHCVLIVKSRDIEVEPAVLHERLPLQRVVFVVALDHEAGRLQKSLLVRLVSNLLNQRLLLLSFLLSQLPVNLLEKFSLKELVLDLLLQLLSVLLAAHIFFI